MKKIFTPLLLLTVLAGNAQTIAGWTFNGSNSSPTTGSGTITLIGGVALSSTPYAAGLGVSSVAMNTTGYPAASTNSGTGGIQVAVSTVGSTGIIFGWSHRHSGSSSRFARVQYTTDGTTFQTFDLTPTNSTGLASHANIDYTNDVFLTTTGDQWTYRSVNFTGITAVNNNPNFAVRIVSVFDPAGTNYLGTQSGYATTGTWRFEDIEVSQNSVLPITLANFTVNVRNQQVLLQWLSSSEINAQGFNVQSSENGTSFTTIGTVSAKGSNSRYEFTTSVSNASFYRLELVDKDGRTSFSNTLAITKNMANGTLQAVPTIVTTQTAIRTVKSSKNSSLLVYNQAGVLVHQQIVPAETIQTSLVVSNLASGQYIIRQLGDGVNASTSIVKQ